MTTVTLLAKIYSTNQRRIIEDTVKSLLEGLDVKATVTGAPSESWMKVTLSGEDETVATNLLARDFGFCPAILQNVEQGAVLRGFVTDLKQSKDELRVDVGVYQPRTILAAVPLSQLQAQLAEGRKIPLDKIVDLWGICENLPLRVRIIAPDEEVNSLSAELAAGQVEKYMLWRDSLLDRLLVFGASAHQVKLAVEQAELERDVIDVESLGMFEHALVCKLGTDAAGLISRLGQRLWKAKFTVFNPKRAIAFHGSEQSAKQSCSPACS